MKNTIKNNIDLRSSVRNSLLQIMDELSKNNINRLPSELELVDALQVSRVTVRAVLAELANEGKLLRRQGCGTFINPVATQLKASLFPMQYYWDIIHNYGYKPSIKFIESSIVSSKTDTESHLNLNINDKVICLKRAYCADDCTCIYCIDMFNSSYLHGRPFNPGKEVSIFQLLYEVSGLVIMWADTKISATDTNRTPELKTLMCDVPYISKPLLLIKNICYDKRDIPVLYTESYVDSDIIGFSYVQQYGSGRTTDSLSNSKSLNILKNDRR